MNEQEIRRATRAGIIDAFDDICKLAVKGIAVGVILYALLVWGVLAVLY